MTIKEYATSVSMIRGKRSSEFISQVEPSYTMQNKGVLGEKSLMCAILMRAWDDLTNPLQEISWGGTMQKCKEFRNPQSSARNWFLEKEGYDYPITFSEVCEILNINKREILKRIKERGIKL
jgi:hypothetical protein